MRRWDAAAAAAAGRGGPVMVTVPAVWLRPIVLMNYTPNLPFPPLPPLFVAPPAFINHRLSFQFRMNKQKSQMIDTGVVSSEK